VEARRFPDRALRPAEGFRGALMRVIPAHREDMTVLVMDINTKC
jgi:hypothetical protein